MLIKPYLVFSGKFGNLVLDGGNHQISVDSVISVVPVRCDNSTESNVLTALNNLNIGLTGTTPQLYSIGPYWFNYRYV